MRILQRASEHIHPMRTHGRGWSLWGRVLREIRVVRWKHKEFTAFSRCVRRVRGTNGLLSCAGNATRRTRANPVPPINTRCCKKIGAGFIARFTSTRMKIRRENATKFDEFIVMLRGTRSSNSPCFVVTMRRRCGWMELMRIETPNTMCFVERERDKWNGGKKKRRKCRNVVSVVNSLLDEWNEESLLSAMKFGLQFPTRGKFSWENEQISKFGVN